MNNLDNDISISFLSDYVCRQLQTFYPDNNNPKELISLNTEEALEKSLYSISYVKYRGFTTFSHLHSDLYAQYIYFLSNIIWKKHEDRITASKLFYLNKTLHGFNCMYDTQLPDIFLFTHPVGAVLGKATYSNYTVFCQNITVGMHQDRTPILGEKLFLAPQSIILGNCTIASECAISASTLIINENIPAKSIVFGKTPNLVIRQNSRNILKELYFNI